MDIVPEAMRISHNGSIKKVVLLMESKLVFVVWDYHKIAFCHIGDNKWTSFYDDLELGFTYDITFYNGQVYTLNLGGKIEACNVNGKDRAVLVDVATTPANIFVDYPAYIVGLDDCERKQLLVIIKKELSIQKSSFRVLAYDLESGNWSKMKDFGKKTSFVGYTSYFWVEDTTGVIKDCIYYTNRIWGDMGIYHLLDETIEIIEPHCFAGKPRTRVRPTLWLQSM